LSCAHYTSVKRKVSLKLQVSKRTTSKFNFATHLQTLYARLYAALFQTL